VSNIPGARDAGRADEIYGTAFCPWLAERRCLSSHCPNEQRATSALNADGRIARLVVEMMGCGLTLGGIARDVSAEFATRLQTAEDALSLVGDLSDRFS
jgi:hypothetical protein